ncbi:chromosome replication initiation protein [Virgibacillus profundi]|uniref:Chromosome replication initiation protein n=1 Tax=Virgibacillus profundi TaxID=2024555 RepID=A0A2A2IH44_9BACI|nr:DnaD domain protein [Virgibacillus profundi]PAV30413.1 chromosome replication initiation protein [Virgibacillus profundi]PXY54585.1 chromosome replication initiation protein [Virgibacillus profundi]
MKYIGKILPIEGYYVLLKEYLPIDYAKSLTHLYQPLLGIQAVVLYQTLLHEMELQQDQTPQTHHTLMNYLNVPLDEIYQARLKLEGIGLLKTYEKKSASNNFYIYELQSPFAPKDFFKDAMLTQLLYHHLGDDKFLALKKHYNKELVEQYGKEITVSFSDVFQTFSPSVDNIEPVLVPEADIQNKNRIDFSWIEQMLKQRMIPVQRVLTNDNRKLISQMMVLYDLASYEIEKSILWALREDNILDINEFKTACHDLFKSKHSESTINLSNKTRMPKKEFIPTTKEEQLIYELETISPKQLLEDLSSGNQASAQDMKVIQQVMTTQGLPSPVMNVLIHYVLLQSNMKLSKAYLEKIASHWSRTNLKTAKEAMVFAKKEKERYQKGATTKPNYRNTGTKEIVPDWFKERKQKQQKPVEKPIKRDAAKEQEEIAALLRQYSSKK